MEDRNLKFCDKIALGTKHFASGTYTMTVADKEGIFTSGQSIYLKGRQTGIITNISEGGSYTFEAAGGETSGRFEIIYKPESVLATGDGAKDDLKIYRTGNDFVVSAQNKKITNLQVYNASGRLFFQIQPNKTKVIIPAESLMNGLYIIKINQDGKITSKKIIK